MTFPTDDLLKWAPILISIAAAVIAWLPYRRPIQERQLQLYAKCRALKFFILDFIKKMEALKIDGEPIANGVAVSFDTSAIDKYGIEKHEIIEFALLDLNYDLKDVIMVGLPARLDQWLNQPTDAMQTRTVFNWDADLRQVSFRIAEYGKRLNEAKELSSDLSLAMGLLRDGFGWETKFKMRWKKLMQNKRNQIL
jgi:hypothetical protein